MVQDGLIVMVVGMLTVYLFLIVLVLLMQTMSKIVVLFPGVSVAQKESKEFPEQIVALLALVYHHQAQAKKTTINEVK
jgi:Na+-transporting methylmalonyl-CoA/oxaloacetate decarboxylase gamma subunit